MNSKKGIPYCMRNRNTPKLPVIKIKRADIIKSDTYVSVLVYFTLIYPTGNGEKKLINPPNNGRYILKT